MVPAVMTNHQPPPAMQASLPLKVRAETSAAALAEVRSRLGDDAIVLATRTLRDPETGARVVEVEATLDGVPPPRTQTAASPAAHHTPRSPLFRLPSGSGLAGAPAAAADDPLNTNLLHLLEELRALREDFRVQQRQNEAAHGEVRQLRRELREVENVVSSLTSEHAIMREYGIPAEWVPAYRRLISALIDPMIAEEILKSAIDDFGTGILEPAGLNEALVDAVADRVKVKPFLSQAVSPPVFAIAGPGGAGKTTMLAKLAAHAVLKGTVSVGMVVMDGAGSLEGLSRVAGALGIPITAAERTHGALARTVVEMRAGGVELILVDTPACKLADREANAELWRELTTVPGLEIIAVLSATTREVDLARASRVLSQLGFHRFAFTHMDETLRTGGLLTAVATTGRPICALSFGARVPDDMALPDAKSLATGMVRPPRIELQTARTVRS